jgi:hypothetical protein
MFDGLFDGSCRQLNFFFGVGMCQLLESFGHILFGKRLGGLGLFDDPNLGNGLDGRQWLLRGYRLGLLGFLPLAWTLRSGTLSATRLSFFRRQLGRWLRLEDLLPVEADVGIVLFDPADGIGVERGAPYLDARRRTKPIENALS